MYSAAAAIWAIAVVWCSERGYFSIFIVSIEGVVNSDGVQEENILLLMEKKDVKFSHNF